jgi:hypothetical protein
MKQVTLTVPWVHIDPIKKNRIKTQFIKIFLKILFYNTGLDSNVNKWTRLCLGTFEYTEADREIYRKCITKPKQYSTTLNLSISHYFTHRIIICNSLLITVRYVTVRTAQNLRKEKINYITWKVLWGRFDPKRK